MELGLAQPQLAAYAHLIVGEYELARNEPDKVVDRTSQALSLLQNQPTAVSRQLAQLYWLRGQAQRRRLIVSVFPWLLDKRSGSIQIGGAGCYYRNFNTHIEFDM